MDPGSDRGEINIDIVLIPGLWLDASSWDEVVTHLEQASHEAHPLTLPGMESRDTDRSGVTRADHVAAIVAAIDSVDGRVALVGHSMGAGLVHAAVDARPDRVARAVYIGGFPDADGSSSRFPSAGGEIPLFDWDHFDEADVRDLDEEARTRFRARAIPSPARAVNDPQRLSDERRYEVPVTMICPEFSSEMLRKWIDDDLEPVRELKRIRDVSYVDLDTGHWPQLTNPEGLAKAVVEALDRDA